MLLFAAWGWVAGFLGTKLFNEESSLWGLSFAVAMLSVWAMAGLIIYQFTDWS